MTDQKSGTRLAAILWFVAAALAFMAAGISSCLPAISTGQWQPEGFSHSPWVFQPGAAVGPGHRTRSLRCLPHRAASKGATVTLTRAPVAMRFRCTITLGQGVTAEKKRERAGGVGCACYHGEKGITSRGNNKDFNDVKEDFNFFRIFKG